MSGDRARERGDWLAWTARTHVGRFRKNNEDAFLALRVDGREVAYLGKAGEGGLEKGDFVFAVSDGMGGAQAGEFASRIAVDKIAELMPRSFAFAALGMDRGCVDLLSELFERIHREIETMGRHYEECRGMGATLSLCWFTPEWMHFAHVGDSRAYYLPRKGGIKQLTHDHTHAGWLLREGKITEREAREHPTKNQLEMSLGGRRKSVSPQTGSVGYEPGDRFLLCTDGVTDGIRDRRLEELTRAPTPRFEGYPPAERLIRDALEESGRDNLTAIVVEAGEPPQARGAG